MKRALFAALFCIVAITLALAADFWVSKPYADWSDKEVKRLLSDSPWAKNFTLRHTVLKTARREFGSFATDAGEGEGQNDPEVSYTVYLRTARPVREALVRAAQLEQQYDRLDHGARQAFDKKWGQFLAADLRDKVIFHVRYRANTKEVDSQLANFWQVQTVETIRDHAAMNAPDGQRLAPVGFWASKGASHEFQIAFPRPPGDFPPDAAVALEFRHPDVPNEPATRMYFRFPFKEMQYKGLVTY